MTSSKSLINQSGHSLYYQDLDIIKIPVSIPTSIKEQNMQSYVKVLSAKTRQGLDIRDAVFKMLDHPRKDKDGLYIVVDGTPHSDLRNGRTRLYIDNPGDYHPIDSVAAEKLIFNSTAENGDTRTDSEITLELRETFDILEEMTKAVASNIVKGLVVSGPAGVGKSFTVESTLVKTLGLLAAFKDGLPQFEFITGGISAPILYTKLWRYKEEGQVLVFDDCDNALYDEESLNILKAALDSKKVRKICWNKDSRILENNDIPNSFEYKGGIIFITNLDFNNVRSPRISNHLEAIVSRCHYMQLGMSSTREKLLHIKDVIARYNMFDGYGFADEERKEVVSYVEVNATKMREMSLRTVLKVADLRKAMPDRWIKFANKNVLKSSL